MVISDDGDAISVKPYRGVPKKNVGMKVKASQLRFLSANM